MSDIMGANLGSGGFRPRPDEVCIDEDYGIFVSASSVMAGPDVLWTHVDGPLLSWAASFHWLTWRERLAIWLRFSTVDEVACKHWPHLDKLRRRLARPTPTDTGGR